MRISSLPAFSIVLLLTVLFAAREPVHMEQPTIKQQEVQDNKDKTEAFRKGSEGNNKQADKVKTINIKTDLVVIDVQVIDRKNQPVFDLIKKEDFTVFEDNVKQEIAHISRDEEPVSLGLVIDTSGSTINILKIVCDSIIELVKQMRPGDEAFIAQFKDESELVQEFTFDKPKLVSAVGDLYASGSNALLDAIIASSDYAKQEAKNRRKALIIFSDGQESVSVVKEKEVIEALTQNEVLVYFVGIIGRNPYVTHTKKDDDLLQHLATSSGARAFFPKNDKEILAVVDQLANELRSQYVLSYYPTNDKHDGTFRAVRVTINNKGKRKLSARTRRGYYAAKDDGN
jgi:Ca-activated chloride channel homolog